MNHNGIKGGPHNNDIIDGEHFETAASATKNIEQADYVLYKAASPYALGTLDDEHTCEIYWTKSE